MMAKVPPTGRVSRGERSEAVGCTRCWAACVATRISNGSQEVCITAGVSKPMM